MISEDVQEAMLSAKEELKRADHSIFVSLKYTRTVDLIKSIIERLINAYDFSITALLLKAKSDRKIREIPASLKERIALTSKLVNHDTFVHFMEFYTLMRKVSGAEFKRDLEFRRHVKMTAYVEDKPIEVTIDIISDYLERTKEFVQFVFDVIHGVKKE